MSDLNVFSYTLILCSAIQLGIKAVLPGGSKSPFYGPMKFLTSLVLLVTLANPLFSFLSHPKVIPDFSNDSLPVSDEISAEQLILEKNRESIASSVRAVYPSAEFSLELIADENFVPTGITVFCEDKPIGKQICSFLETNYSLLTTLQTRKDGNGP